MKLKVNVSQKRIESAIAEGIVLNKKMFLDVNLDSLSQEEREVLSRNIRYDDSNGYFDAMVISSYDGKKTSHEFDSEKLNDVITEMKKYEQISYQEFLKRKNEITQEINNFLSGESNRIFGNGYYSDKSGSFIFENIKNQAAIYSRKYEMDIDVDAILKRAEIVQQEIEKYKAEKTAKYLAEEAEKAAKKQAEEAEKEAKKQALKEWALKNGSYLLKARIEENLNWFDLANSEYFDSLIPEGFVIHDDDDYDSCWDYNNPTLEHIKELREARKNNVFEDVKLRKCRKVDDYEDKTFYYFVVGTIRSFDGSYTIEVSKLLDKKTITIE